MHYRSDSSQPLYQMVIKMNAMGKKYTFRPPQNIGSKHIQIEWGSAVERCKTRMVKVVSPQGLGKCAAAVDISNTEVPGPL